MRWLIASLEERGDAFHIVFRFAGTKYSRSLKTADREAAETRLGNLEQTIRDVKSGRFVMPEGADVATFLLSDGKLTEPPKPEKSLQAHTLGDLLAQFFDGLPAPSKSPP